MLSVSALEVNCAKTNIIFVFVYIILEILGYYFKNCCSARRVMAINSNYLKSFN